MTALIPTFVNIATLPWVDVAAQEIHERMKALIDEAAHKIGVWYRDNHYQPTLHKADEAPPSLDGALDSLKWDDLLAPLHDYLAKMYQAGKTVPTTGKFRPFDASLDQPDLTAIDYAKRRSAELVGKKVLDDGSVIDNPSQEWAVTPQLREDIRGLVQSALEGHELTPDQLARDIQHLSGFGYPRARMISRTELAFAYNSGHHDQAHRMGYTLKSSILGSLHKETDECDDNAAEGWIPMEQLFRSGDEMAPYHPNCLVPGTGVVASSIAAAYERWYEGEVVTIRIPGVEDLTVTPNHPILTDGGWVPAKQVKSGDLLLQSVSPSLVLSIVDPHHQQVEASCQDLFAALLMHHSLGTSRYQGITTDFHGDGLGSEVQVVHVARPLRGESQPGGFENTPYDLFSGRKGSSVLLDSDGALELLLQCVDARFSSSVCSSSESPPLIESLAGGDEELLLPEGTDLQSQSAKSHTDRLVVTPLTASKLHSAFARHVSVVEVSEVVVGEYSGHVYNFSTASNWYFANGIIVHNCVCDVIYKRHEGENAEDWGSNTKMSSQEVVEELEKTGEPYTPSTPGDVKKPPAVSHYLPLKEVSENATPMGGNGYDERAKRVKSDSAHWTASERSVVRDYTYQGDQRMNSALRTGGGGAKDKQDITTLNEVIDRYTMDANVVTFRGVGVDVGKHSLETFKGYVDDPAKLVNDPLLVGDKAFTSTSANLHTAKTFMGKGYYSWRNNSFRVLLRTVIPEGAPALPLGGLSRFSDERELLLKSGSVQRVVKITAQPEVYAVRMRGASTHTDVYLNESPLEEFDPKKLKRLTQKEFNALYQSGDVVVRAYPGELGEGQINAPSVGNHTLHHGVRTIVLDTVYLPNAEMDAIEASKDTLLGDLSKSVGYVGEPQVGSIHARWEHDQLLLVRRRR